MEFVVHEMGMKRKSNQPLKKPLLCVYFYFIKKKKEISEESVDMKA